MAQESPYEKIMLMVPEPFFQPWQSLIGICEDVRSSKVDESHEHWPIHALGIKAARTTLSIATLAAMRLWPDALILGRSLFETEIIIKYLLESNTNQRIRDYLAETGEEEARVARKMNQGVSVTAQIMRDIYGEERFQTHPKPTQRKKGRRLSVRERAKRIALERSYDFSYWMGSILAHSHALSLSEWNRKLAEEDSPFIDWFGGEDKGLPSWTVLEALPMNALDALELVSFHFDLNLENDILETREAFRELIFKVSKGGVKFSSELERGEIMLESEDGSSKVYTPKKSGQDPLDRIHTNDS